MFRLRVQLKCQRLGFECFSFVAEMGKKKPEPHKEPGGLGQSRVPFLGMNQVTEVEGSRNVKDEEGDGWMDRADRWMEGSFPN